MKKNKVLAILLITTSLTGVISPTTAMAKVNKITTTANFELSALDENVLEVKDDKLNYNSTIELLNSNDEFSKFIIRENSDEFELIITTDGKYIIDNKIYSHNDYMAGVEKQFNFIEKNKNIVVPSLKEVLKNSPFTVNTQSYNQNVNTELADSHMIKCTSCSHGNLSTVPTSNYGKDYYQGTIKPTNKYLLSLTVGAIAAFASFYTFKDTTVAKSVMTAFISGSGGALVGLYVSPEYNKYQAFHNTCPKAVKEKRVFYINELTQNGYIEKSTTRNFYFYGSKPWEISN